MAVAIRLRMGKLRDAHVNGVVRRSVVEVMPSRRTAGAVQQRDAPDEALGLKMLRNDLRFINVRFAGDPGCSADLLES